ncbi:spore germination protein [Alkalihalophilus pseudofirmus]|uniref:Spore germination protein n=1 Tax=Alkalihalophilus pseudofirmus TaxID=79885 RepID=A0AAJ2NK42_ALKPS|nr:spore germination protein [Alkalihalophilus pseudofirmus]MDV2884077.1 spore germination protein [Alkalihalophilus pseudofirmus]WEG18098.1 spore germination protein [Alkalihalophilus pseudofirmus]
MSWFSIKKRLSLPTENKTETVTIAEAIEDCLNSSDFEHRMIVTTYKNVWVSYYTTLIDSNKLHDDVIEKIQGHQFHSPEDLRTFIPLSESVLTSDGKIVADSLMRGYVCIHLEEESNLCLLIAIQTDDNREITIPEVEFSVIGPKESFVEGIDTNINLIRKRIPIPDLKVKEYTVGSLSRTRVCVIYIDSIANEENVNTMIQRVSAIQFDQINDSSYITQMIEDQTNSPFPQFIDTERPDRVAALLAEGKVVVAVDGSPQVITGPTTLVEFFSAFEDYFLSWHIATAFRLIRLFAVWFSIFATPLYVAVLTYHAEIIPQDLLATLIVSRSQIPFPPILEALFLELTIELLREAGARLPTKVGQTIGIVGGIVIGTAAVEAGLTSNVLLIIVALAALASFTTPVYRMGNTIRLIRFPYIFASQLWGLVGLAILFNFMLVHLLTITSLGRPYLAPLYPTRLSDFKDAFFRMPFNLQSKRPIHLQTKNNVRFEKQKAKKKKDIDEGI